MKKIAMIMRNDKNDLNNKPPDLAILLSQEVFIMGRKDLDLDYLQWLQRNAHVYLTGLAILSFLIALSFWMFSSNPWQPKNENGIAFLADRETNEAVAEQDVPEQNKEIEQSNVKNESQKLTAVQEESVTEKDAAADTAAQTDETKPVEKNEATVITVDPTQWEGFAAPCNGQLLYGYGFGYDPIHEDYRFHDRLCYSSDDGLALSAQSGIVQKVALEQQNQLEIQCDGYTLIYSGLQSCDISVGQSVVSGQLLGTVEKYLYIQAIKQ